MSVAEAPKHRGRPRAMQPDPQTPQGQWSLHLATLLEQRGMTAEEFADATGWGRSSVYRWMRGEACPPVADWGTLARALGFDRWTALVP